LAVALAPEHDDRAVLEREDEVQRDRQITADRDDGTNRRATIRARYAPRPGVRRLVRS